MSISKEEIQKVLNDNPHIGSLYLFSSSFDMSEEFIESLDSAYKTILFTELQNKLMLLKLLLNNSTDFIEQKILSDAITLTESNLCKFFD